MSHDAAPSQCARLPSPTVATQLFLTYWHAIVALRPQVASHDWAFWQDAAQASPPRRVKEALPFAQNRAHPESPSPAPPSPHR